MIETAEQTVMRFLRALWDGQRDAAKATFADNAEWWFMPSLPYPRPMRAHDACDAVLDDMIAGFDPDVGLSIEVHAVMSNPDGEVAAEYSAISTTRAGASYENRYVLRATVKGGRITCVRPYMDPNHLNSLIDETKGAS